MSDLIRREDVLDALRNLAFEHTFQCGEYYGEDERQLTIINAGKAIDAIDTIPSAEPERKWTPVTEALPKDMDRLLVTIVRSDGSKRVRSGHYYKGYFMLDNGDTWNATDKEVLAWMPLPEPWKGE